MRIRTVCLLSLMLLLAGGLTAGTVDVNSSAGVWTSATLEYEPGTLNGVGTSQIAWGTPATNAGQSSYLYTAAAPPPINNIPAETPFLLGTFTHFNNPVYAPSITSAVLQITLGMTIPSGGANVSKVFNYTFNHDETPNGASPCPYTPNNANGCSDQVVIASAPGSQTFLIGNTWYTLQLGFGTSPTNIVNSFVTQEGVANTANIYGTFTSKDVPQVPEPGSMLALGLGLGGVAMAIRRRRQLS